MVVNKVNLNKTESWNNFFLKLGSLSLRDLCSVQFVLFSKLHVLLGLKLILNFSKTIYVGFLVLES